MGDARWNSYKEIFCISTYPFLADLVDTISIIYTEDFLPAALVGYPKQAHVAKFHISYFSEFQRWWVFGRYLRVSRISNDSLTYV